MTPPMKPALFLLVAICLLLPASACPAEILIRGNITDRQGKPVEAVIVKLFQGNALVAYTSSKADGSYQLGGTPETPQVRLTFEHLSYQTQALTLENRSQTQDVVLEEKSLTLKEVTVTAPVIAQQGDTLSFRLSAFTGAGDISLRDALRKIPGIHVAQNGKIRYLGKDISRFYIEGLDLLGGQYNIATNNLPASYISTVQVLNHHQPVKLEKKVFSDQVALNVKLNPKAKFRPIGNYEASAGYGDEMLYQLSAAGMLFNPDFQSILTAKIGNVREFEQEENAHLITDESDGHDAPDLLGRLSSSTPPLDRKRYIHPDDRSLTLNILNRTGQDATLKAQIGYGYTRTRYDFQTLRSYYNGTSDLVLEEAQAPLAHTHTPELTLKYELNADQRYVTNILSTSASLCEDQLPTRRNLSEIRQTEEMQRYALSNAFQLRWKRGAVRWNFSSLLKYDAHPTGRLSLSTESEADNDLIQTTRNYRFFTREALSLAYDFHRSSLYFPWTFQATSDRIHTHLSLPGTSERNDLSGENYELSFAPRYEYTHPRQKYVFRAELALKGEHHRFQNTGNAPARDKGFRFSLNPYLYFNYKLNAKSTLRARLSYNRGNIDILDLLTAPIQTDYLTRSYQRGLLADVKTWTTSKPALRLQAPPGDVVLQPGCHAHPHLEQPARRATDCRRTNHPNPIPHPPSYRPLHLFGRSQQILPLTPNQNLPASVLYVEPECRPPASPNGSLLRTNPGLLHPSEHPPVAFPGVGLQRFSFQKLFTLPGAKAKHSLADAPRQAIPLPGFCPGTGLLRRPHPKRNRPRPMQDLPPARYRPALHFPKIPYMHRLQQHPAS